MKYYSSFKLLMSVHIDNAIMIHNRSKVNIDSNNRSELKYNNFKIRSQQSNITTNFRSPRDDNGVGSFDKKNGKSNHNLYNNDNNNYTNNKNHNIDYDGIRHDSEYAEASHYVGNKIKDNNYTEPKTTHYQSNNSDDDHDNDVNDCMNSSTRTIRNSNVHNSTFLYASPQSQISTYQESLPSSAKNNLVASASFIDEDDNIDFDIYED